VGLLLLILYPARHYLDPILGLEPVTLLRVRCLDRQRPRKMQDLMRSWRSALGRVFAIDGQRVAKTQAGQDSRLEVHGSSDPLYLTRVVRLDLYGRDGASGPTSESDMMGRWGSRRVDTDPQ
jgi:hypothetical protein